MHKVCKGRSEGGRGTERGLRYSDFALKYFRKNNYMHMPHKSGKNGMLFMTEDTKRVRQKGDSMRGGGGKGGECREELEERPLHELFCGFWQCQDTTHDTKPNGKKTYQACWRSCYSRCCCCCSTRSSSKGGTRDAANKTKQNKAEQSRVEWSRVERWQLLIHSQ